MLQMVAQRSSRSGSWKEGSPREREWTMRRHFLQSPSFLLFELLFILLKL
jgi:hypothetical protein